MAQKEGGMGIGEIALIAVGGYLLYNYFFNSAAAAPATTAPVTTPVTTTPVTSTPVTTPVTTSPPATTPPASPPASTPPAAAISIVGAVTTNINNSLSANVNVNGTITNVTIIYPAMTAWNTSGQNVTAQLTALGVNVPALAQQMLAAYNTANPGNTFASGLSGFLPFIWGRGMGNRGVGAMQPYRGQNYVRRGAPMRRIG